ncbi:MAG: amino acid permease, partial [Acidimicrobiia bacterium]|nr:amino acid permease [Acidimicrobiia bacterium]
MSQESGDQKGSADSKITLSGAVSMGTGVMIGAGVFALMGQVAGTAGKWFPLAFLAAAVVAAITSYSYVK